MGEREFIKAVQTLMMRSEWLGTRTEPGRTDRYCVFCKGDKRPTGLGRMEQAHNPGCLLRELDDACGERTRRLNGVDESEADDG